MEEEIWQWREDAVCDRIDKLILDLEMVGIVNETIDGSAESVERVRATLENMLSFIRVPGCIFAKLDFDWVDALQIMRDISMNKWVGYTLEDKRDVIAILDEHMAEAVENINDPLDALKKYIAKTGLGSFSNDEYEALLKKLRKESYDQTESNFKDKLKKEIDELAYTTKANMLKNIWKNTTGVDSIKAWMQKWNMSVVWAMPELSEHFATLLSIGRNERVDISCIENAIAAIQTADLSELSDKDALDMKFVENVSSDKNKDLILPHIDALKKYVAKSYPDASSWPSNTIGIRKLTEKYVRENLRAEVGDKAKAKVSSFNEIQLRKTLERILENCVDACSIVLDE